jgi:hypothetical protein
LLVAALATALGAAGCGDGPICQSEVLVIIQSPSGPVLDDVNVDMDGVQVDVSVRSTFPALVDVTLQVLDADERELSTVTAPTDENGDVVFEDVTLDEGAAILVASGDAGECGSDEDRVRIDLGGGNDCAVTIRQTPIENDFYAPLGVLNLSNDTDTGSDDFQGDVDVATAPGFEVELFVTDDGVESSAGNATADDAGDASFAVTLGQGRQSLRAVCRSSSGSSSNASTSTAVFVDTEAPDCAMTNPTAGSTITPAYDSDDDTSNGVQLTLEANAAGGDVEGEAARFEITVDGSTVIVAGTDVDATGDTSAPASIDPASVPGGATVALHVLDHAGNACDLSEDYDVVYDGCTISVTAPTSTVTADANGDPTDGVQVDVDVHVSAECAEEDVTSSCGDNDPSETTDAGGNATLTVDWCDQSPCDRTASCTFTVTSPAGIETSVGATIDYDDQAPPVGVQISQPALACGAQVTPAVDLDGDAANGVQVEVRVVAPLATTRQLRQTDGAGTQTFDATAGGGAVLVTIVDGTTSFVGVATDDVGNAALSPACTITLADISLTFSAPAADGSVGTGDGVVAGNALTFDLCGTVSDAAATVTVAVDGGAGLPAIVTGTTWCRALTLAASPPTHTIVASATDGALTGQNTLILAVDLTAPDDIADLAVFADTRQSLTATWTAPSDGGGGQVSSYVMRVSTTVLTDANFDTTGEIVPTGTPGTPGATELVRSAPRRTGTPYWVAVAAVDAGGNRGTAAIAGPVVPLFDQTSALVPPAPVANALFGLTVARGRFNDDDLYDVAVSASGLDANGHTGAGVVYVYFGTEDGILDVPDVEIDGGADFGGFGLSLAAVRWSSTTREDLVVGEPYSHSQDGRVYVFEGGPAFSSGVIDAGLADIEIGVNPTSNYFTSGALGWSLAALDFDGDGRDDLAIGDAVGGNGNGGVAIVYGGTVNGSQVLLSDSDSTQLDGAVVHLIDDPRATSFDIFGNYLFNVGPTRGAADRTDDLVVSYADGGNAVYVMRGLTSRPASEGVYQRAFVIGRDVRIDRTPGSGSNEFGSSAASIPDVNGDGARELVIGAYRDHGGGGELDILDGNTLGTGGVATTSDAGITVGTITSNGADLMLGAAIVNNSTAPGADVDGDGNEDLLVTSVRAGVGTILVWFGGEIPTGNVTSDTAGHVITGPSTFTGVAPGFGGTMHAITWAGDVNGDGLDDICWGDGTGNGGAGSFQVLWDDGT